jgi:hypothetical protein
VFQNKGDHNWRKQGSRCHEDWRASKVSSNLWVFPAPYIKKVKSIALKAAKGKSRTSSNEETDEDEGFSMHARSFKKLIKKPRNSRTNFLTIWEVTPRDPNKMKPTRRILEALEVMNVQATVTCGLITGISSRQKERLSTILSVMIQRKKKRLQLRIQNF